MLSIDRCVDSLLYVYPGIAATLGFMHFNVSLLNIFNQ
jgi:hypothetical protein